MDYFIGTFNPLESMDRAIFSQTFSRSPSKEAVTAEFASIFYAEILKESLKGFGEEKNSFLPGPINYDIFIDRFASELALKEKFGLQEIINKK